MFYYVLFGRKHSRRTTDQNWNGTTLNFGSQKKKKNQTNQPDVSVRSDHPDGPVVRPVRPPRRKSGPSGYSRRNLAST